MKIRCFKERKWINKLQNEQNLLINQTTQRLKWRNKMITLSKMILNLFNWMKYRRVSCQNKQNKQINLTVFSMSKFTEIWKKNTQSVRVAIKTFDKLCEFDKWKKSFEILYILNETCT